MTPLSSTDENAEEVNFEMAAEEGEDKTGTMPLSKRKNKGGEMRRRKGQTETKKRKRGDTRREKGKGRRKRNMGRKKGRRRRKRTDGRTEDGMDTH